MLSEFGQAGTDLEGLVRKALDEAYFRWCDDDDLSPITRGHLAREIALSLSAAGIRGSVGG